MSNNNNASFNALNANFMFIKGVPLLVDGVLNEAFCSTNMTKTECPSKCVCETLATEISAIKEQLQTMQSANTPVQIHFGSFTRRDINAGMLVLEVAEDGTYASFSKNNELVHELSGDGLHIVGVKHNISSGVCYTLTQTENAILEINDDNRKYILTSRRK